MPELKHHMDRWNFPDSFKNWEADVDRDLRNFIEFRPCAVKDHLMAHFELENFNFDCDPEIEDSFDDNHFTLAPNPNVGNFHLRNNSSAIANATINITSISGQVVYQERNINLLKREHKHFYFPDFAKGAYIFQITTEDVSE